MQQLLICSSNDSERCWVPCDLPERNTKKKADDELTGLFQSECQRLLVDSIMRDSTCLNTPSTEGQVLVQKTQKSLDDAAWQAFLAEVKQEFAKAGLPDFSDKLDAFVKFAA